MKLWGGSSEEKWRRISFKKWLGDRGAGVSGGTLNGVLPKASLHPKLGVKKPSVLLKERGGRGVKTGR